MPLTQEQLEAMKAASAPLIQWLNENGNPHTSAIVTTTECEILEGTAVYKTYEFVK